MLFHRLLLLLFLLTACGETEQTTADVTPPAPLLVNEIMAKNRFTISDETGATPDWIEIYNRTDAVGGGRSAIQSCCAVGSTDCSLSSRTSMTSSSLAGLPMTPAPTDNHGENGGGLLAVRCVLDLADSRITSNTASLGGGVAISECSGRMDNEASQGGG